MSRVRFVSELLVSALADAAVQLFAFLLRRLLCLLRRILCPKLKEAQKAGGRIPDEDLFE